MDKQLENKCDVYNEVLTYIAYFDEELLEKIPDEFLQNLVSEAADSTKQFIVDPQKSFEEQIISEEAKSILALIYYRFVADDAEKEKLMKLWS